MRKLFGIALVVGLIWLGVTVFGEGTQVVTRWMPWVEADDDPEPSPLERIRASSEAARNKALERTERQLGPESDEEPDE